MYRLMLVLGLLVVGASGTSAQTPDLRIQQHAAAPRPVALALVRKPDLALQHFADSTQQATYWKNGWWTGVAIGAVLGTVIAVGNREGYPHTFSEKVWGSVVAGTVIGVPLGVIGGLIGDAFKKPVRQASSP